MAHGNRIPEAFRRSVSLRIRQTMKPHVKANGITKECREAAKALELAWVSVYFWYEGQTLPTIYNLVRFCELYDVSVDYVLGRKLAAQVAA